MKMSATPVQFWSAAAFLLICLNLNLSDSFVLPPPPQASDVASAQSKDSIFLNTLRAPALDDSDSDSEPPSSRTNSRRIRSVFSVPVKPQSDCPEGSRRVTETGECVEAAPDIKSGGDKFLIDSLKNFYRSTTRKPPRRRRTTTTTTTPGPGSISGSGFKTTARSGQGDELTTTLQAETVPETTSSLDPAPTPTDQTEPPTTTTAEEVVPTTSPGVPDFLDTTSFIFDGPSKARVDFHHVHTPKYHCLYVGYVVTEPGIYFIHIYYAGFPVGGTPFWVQIRGVEDASKASKVRVRGEALKIMREGEESAFKISTKYSGDGALAVCITGPCRVRMSSTSIGSCTKISFTPLQPGYYFISIKFNDFHVPGSPFRSECHCLCDARSSDGPPLPADNGIRKRQWVFV